MIVSDRYQFIFIHNPKSAPQALRDALAPYDDRDNHWWGFAEESPMGWKVDKAHLRLQDFLGYQDSLLMGRYFVFTTVRHPIQRAMAAYLEFQDKGYGFEAADASDFVLRHLEPERINTDHRFVHFCPQHFFTHIWGERRARWIGHYESLHEHVGELGEMIDLDLALDRAPDAPTPTFSTAALHKLGELYAKDFELFDYA